MAVWPVLESSPNFFSAGVQLSEGIPLLLLANWVVSVAIVAGKLLQQLLFGELRLLEIEHIYERSRFEVVNSLIALTMFSNDWLLVPGILTLVLLFVKVFHWLLTDRFEAVFQRATTMRDVLLTRNSATLLVLLYTDFTMVYSCAEYTFGNNPDVYFAFGFEFAVLFLDLLNLTGKLLLNTWEVQYLSAHPQEEAMDSKNFYMKLLKLAYTSSSLLIHFFLLFTFLGPYRFPIYLFKDIIFNSLGLIKQFKELRMYLKTAKELDSRLLDATEADLGEENNLCIICRDDMTTEGVNRGERLYPKKLPCGHIIHMGCLKGWLEISQVCPLCRGAVFTEYQQANVPAMQPPNGGNQNDAANIANDNDDPPHGAELFQAPEPQVPEPWSREAQAPRAASPHAATSLPTSESTNILSVSHNALVPPDWTLFKLTGDNDNYRVQLSPGQDARLTRVNQEPRVAPVVRFENGDIPSSS